MPRSSGLIGTDIRDAIAVVDATGTWLRQNGSPAVNPSTTSDITDGGNDTLLINPDNVSADFYNVYQNLSVSEDWSATETIIIRVFVDDYDYLAANPLGFSIQLNIHSGGIISIPFFKDMTLAGNLSLGWNNLVLHKSQFTDLGGDWADITAIGIRVNLNTGATGLTGTRKVYFSNATRQSLSRCMVTWRFDDGRMSVHDEAFPLLAAKGYIGWINTIANNVGLNATMMDVAELATLFEAGWDIKNHGKAGSSLLSFASDAEREAEIAEGQSAIDARGQTGKYKMYSYNNGDVDESFSAAKNAGMQYAMATSTRGFPTFNNQLGKDDYLLRLGVGVDAPANVTEVDFRARLELAIQRGTVFTILAHDLVASAPGSTETLISLFTTYIAIVKEYEDQGLLDVVGIDEMFDRVNGKI